MNPQNLTLPQYSQPVSDAYRPMDSAWALAPKACAGHPDAEAWQQPRFAAGTHLNRRHVEAKRICQTECPAVALCLDEALIAEEEFGIWGGLDPAERAACLGRTLGDREAGAIHAGVLVILCAIVGAIGLATAGAIIADVVFLLGVSVFVQALRSQQRLEAQRAAIQRHPSGRCNRMQPRAWAV